MEKTVKYPKTDEGRRQYVKDSLIRKTLPRSVNVPKFLTSKEIIDNSFQVIPKQVKKDQTLEVMNLIGMIILVLMISPLIVIYVLYAGLRWLFKLRYPMTNEARNLLRTRDYLHTCKHYHR
jgi:hypothetical protein